MKHLIKNFAKCGLTGWCMEIIFTSLGTLRKKEFTLKGTTSIWMFPNYGCAAFLSPLCRLLKNAPVFLRGITYMGCIFSGEYLSGYFLKKHKLCPWDYSDSRFNINSLIRLDYAPFWFLAGLLFEKLILPSKISSS